MEEKTAEDIFHEHMNELMKDKSLSKAQELYDQNLVACHQMATELYNARIDTEETGLLAIKSGLQIAYIMGEGEPGDNTLRFILDNLNIAFINLETANEYLERINLLLDELSKKHYKIKIQHVTDTVAEVLSKGDFDDRKYRFYKDQRVEEDGKYLRVTRKLCERMDELLSSRFFKIVDVDEEGLIELREKIARSCMKKQKEEIGFSSAVVLKTAVDGHYDNIMTALKNRTTMSIEEHYKYTVMLSVCMFEAEYIIANEETFNIRASVSDNKFVSVPEEAGETWSREVFVKVASGYLNSTVQVNGVETSFDLVTESRKNIIEKIKKYTDEILEIKPDYVAPDLPDAGAKGPTSVLMRLNKGTEPSKRELISAMKKAAENQNNSGATVSTNNTAESKEKTKEKPNTIALIGFMISVFSLLFNLFGIVGAVGAIVSGVSLKKIKASGEKGKVLAYVGIIVGIYSVIYGIIQTINLM